MDEINSPVELFAALTAMFPEFAAEWEDDEEVKTYHRIVLRLTPLITGYLREAPAQLKAFADLVNTMVAAGGDKENAVSTCLLEHASQVSLRKLIRPHLSAAVRRQLR